MHQRGVACAHALPCSTSGPPQVDSERAVCTAQLAALALRVRSSACPSSQLCLSFRKHFTWLLSLAPGTLPGCWVESQASVSVAVISPSGLLSHRPSLVQHLQNPFSSVSPDPSSAVLARARSSSGICTFCCQCRLLKWLDYPFFILVLNIAIKMVLNLNIIVSHFFLSTSLKCIGCFSDQSHVIF